MYCPSCGATIKKKDQRYCQDCGTSLPDPRGGGVPALRGQTTPAGPFGAGPNVANSRQDTILGLVPATMKNRLIVYGGGVVAAVVAIYVVVSAIIGLLITLVPLFIVAVLAFLGFQIWRSRSR
jgi:hypothetical protein